jgi:succinyl-diaminopimelate desuccinylase
MSRDFTTALLCDPVALTQDLIRCPSVTPAEGGALDYLQAAFNALGATCTRLPFSDAEDTPDVDNLFARIGTAGPHLCFAGHTDVVPVGDGWSADPFAADIKDGFLFGRGTADMKGAIACFTAAVARFQQKHGHIPGSISFLITGDEEGPAINGTVKMLDWVVAHQHVPDACLVGEPTNPLQMGQMIKIGRRGSVNFVLTALGTQGHVAYPERARNPNHMLVDMLAALTATPLDHGSDHFQASSLQITSIDVGNPATNMIPNTAKAMINVRFNDLHSGESVAQWVKAKLNSTGHAYDLQYRISGESFVTQPGAFTDLLQHAIETVTQQKPELSTSGGTSDARFIQAIAPVCEFGLVGQTMHKADERVAVADLHTLTDIYSHIIEGWFA